ncbi:MAG TPA: tRNA 2-thiouridine(34) synthase MnmA [Gemmataceae bacterium]|nr:tRNA 2-thiouridine(34) synthase MnmA [Gemmataceae bacterium]
MPGRVVLAMSGGVDSSASAVLLKEQGYDVVGLFMRTGAHTDESDGRRDNKKGCCSAIDAGDARRVADRLDIPFCALDFEREFDRVIDYFADEYLAGRTPNPCVVCNTWLKFGELWEFGRRIEADFIATGHYARILTGPTGEPELHKAVDPDKDQSYVLSGLRRDILPRLLFPVGGFRKEEVRALARRAGLAEVAGKPDSVEICFVPDGDHAKLIRKRRRALTTAGAVVDTVGNVLGEHEGYERFTIGQRKGLGIATDRKRYVLGIVPETRTVVLGDRDDLLASGLNASGVNWLANEPAGPLRCTVKIRYRNAGSQATVWATPVSVARVQFDEPQIAVTPGQTVVFYDGSRVLGGGWIDTPIAAGGTSGCVAQGSDVG